VCGQNNNPARRREKFFSVKRPLAVVCHWMQFLDQGESVEVAACDLQRQRGTHVQQQMQQIHEARFSQALCSGKKLGICHAVSA
jgi:hypothetical protein